MTMETSLLTILLLGITTQVDGADFFLTIGGGYSREGNQASLEANVQFLQDVLKEEYSTSPRHEIFFADGLDERADLQVLAATPQMTAERLIASLHSRSRSTRTPITYRNHQVRDVTASTKPANIKTGLQQIAMNLASGDRLFVYVTAHGSAAKGKNKYNTTIDCWDRKSINASEFSKWLDQVPADVPVIMVMAQCFCGGFSHTIFNNADIADGISDHLRTGFFAQQHNLAAAGCRPDIDNDEEYSSFFWGALVGRSRTGKRIENVDLNHDGVTSFAEAHAHAVLASNTIDIPLRASESLLREFSRLQRHPSPGSETLSPRGEEGDDESTNQADDRRDAKDMIELLSDTDGTLANLAADARPDVRELIHGLTGQLGMATDIAVRDVVAAWEQKKQEFRDARRSSFRGRSRRDDGRTELREEIFFVWPELADRENWRDSELLSVENRDGLLDDIKLMPSYPSYEKSLQQREQASDVVENAELLEIKFRRLVETLVSVALAKNLPDFASAEIVDRYHQMLAIEESGFAN